MVKNEKTFTGSDVQVLEWYEGMRKRYGMYAGVDPVNHCVKEILDNSIDEYMIGFGEEIDVYLDTNKNSITIVDNGRGIPHDIHPKEKKPTMEVLFSNVHAGSKFNDDSGDNVGGLNGVGVKIANALSKSLRVESERDGKRMFMEFSGGKVTKGLTTMKTKGKRGTTVIFTPDDTVFEDENLHIFNKDMIKETCKMRAFLNKGIKINLTIDKEKISYEYDNGINDLIDELLPVKLFDMSIIGFDKTVDLQEAMGVKGINRYEIALAYDPNTTNETFMAYTNGIVNIRGTHLTGFKMALTNIFNKYIQDNNLLPKKNKNIQITGEDIRKGIFVIINIKIRNPKYEGQTKEGIGNKEVQSHIMSLMNEFFNEWIPNNENIMKKICQRIVQFAVATENIKKEQEKIVRVSMSNSGLTFSNKFIDCAESDPKKCELFICEGKSASGSLRRGRVGDYQAIYALRGKPLNIFGSSQNTILNNFEFNELTKILFGTNDLKNINYDDIRYQHVVIASDADDDGLHIQSLMSMGFREHYQELVNRGYLYIACPPKYRITVNGKYKYFKNDKEYNSFKTNYLEKRYSIETEGIKILDVVKKSDEFMTLFKNLKNKHSLPSDVISMILTNDTMLPVAEYLDEQKLEVSETGDDEFYAQGLLDNDWIDIELNEQLSNEVKQLKNIFGVSTFDLYDKKDEVTYECDIVDAIELLEKEFNFTRYRYKGLGEVNPEELRVTTMDPATRDIIKIVPTMDSSENDLNKILFGGNADLRKDFIQENLI